MFDASSQGQTARSQWRIWPIPMFLLFCFCVSVIGCGGCSSKPPITEADKPKSKANNNPPGWDLLDPALSMMQPENLGINANPDQPTGLLNQWRTVQMEVEKKTDRFSDELPEETKKLLETNLSQEAVQQADRDTFTADDARHIRTSMLMKSIVDRVAKGVDGEVGRAQVVFDFVTRNIELVPEDKALPLTPYEILIFGEGTPEDRAWVFAELLQQVSQDAVIVKPLTESSETAPWFIGVIVKQDIYLFDPLRSTPVPVALQPNPQEIQPATLADLSQPEILESLTAGTEAKLSPDMFADVRLEAIGTPAFWSPRMEKLQSFLAGTTPVLISQPVIGGKPETSLWGRLVSLNNKHVRSENIRLWSYPEQQLEAFGKSESLSTRWKPFQAPQHIEMNPETQEASLGNFSWLQLKTRTQQLMGTEDQLTGLHRDAIQAYMRIQLACKRLASVLPGDLASLHRDANEDAFFWAGICLMEQEEYDAAAKKFADIVRQSEQFTTRHSDQARILLARCSLQMEKPEEALKALSGLKPASPEYAAGMFLQNDLKSAGTKAAVEPKPESVPPQDAESAKSESLKPKTHQPAVAEKPAA